MSWGLKIYGMAFFCSSRCTGLLLIGLHLAPVGGVAVLSAVEPSHLRGLLDPGPDVAAKVWVAGEGAEETGKVQKVTAVC